MRKKLYIRNSKLVNLTWTMSLQYLVKTTYVKLLAG